MKILRKPKVTFGPRRREINRVPKPNNDKVHDTVVCFIVDVKIDGTNVGELRKQIGTMVPDDGGTDVLDKTDAMTGYVPSRTVDALFSLQAVTSPSADTLDGTKRAILEKAQNMHWDDVDWKMMGLSDPLRYVSATKGKTRTLYRRLRRCAVDSKLVKNGGTRGLIPRQRRKAKEIGMCIVDELKRRAGSMRDPAARAMVWGLPFNRLVESLRTESVSTT